MEKERSVKLLIISILFMLIAGLTVAFAALSTTLNINGTAYLDAAKWGIRFENLSSPTRVGKATTTGTARIEEAKAASVTGMNVGLSIPGDKIVYTVDLVNKGTINAKIDNIEKTVLTREQQRYLTFKVTDKDGYEIKQGDILEKGETKKITITIEFIKDLTKEDLPKQTSTISLSYKLNCVQTDDKATSGSQGNNFKTYSVGDEFCLENECFYVIKDNGTTVDALAKYNLLVGNTVVWNEDFSNTTSVTPIDSSAEGYGLQSSKAASYSWNTEGDLPTTNTITGSIAFANKDESRRIPNCTKNYACYYGYWTDNTSKHNLLSKYGTRYPANVFDNNSLLYEPVQNYKTYLKNTLGKTSVDARLITYKELIGLGCGKSGSSCKSAPSWVYSVNYWTASADDDTYVWSVYSDDTFGSSGSDFNIYGAIGLRPVITISKSEI